MGTRSLTFVHEDDGPAIVCIYRQFDGYFDGVGDEILTFLKGSAIVTGIPGGNPANIFNGAGDLAARLITHYKGGDDAAAGNVYICPADSADVGEEYVYHIYATFGQEPRLTATAVYADFTVEGPVSEIVWPQQDDDGNYIAVERTGPLTEDQRRAIFAAWNEVAGDRPDAARYEFIRKALGKSSHAKVSMSLDKSGTLTYDEASRVLDALAAARVL